MPVSNRAGYTPLAVCHFYRQVCDLPAEVDPPHLGRIILRAGRVRGLMMPAFIYLSARPNERLYLQP